MEWEKEVCFVATGWWKKQEGSLGEAVGHFSTDSPKTDRTMLGVVPSGVWLGSGLEACMCFVLQGNSEWDELLPLSEAEEQGISPCCTWWRE